MGGADWPPVGRRARLIGAPDQRLSDWQDLSGIPRRPAPAAAEELVRTVLWLSVTFLLARATGVGDGARHPGGRRGRNGGRGRPAPSMLSRGSCSLSQPSPPAVVGQVLGPRAVAPSSLPAGTVVQVVAVPARPVQRVAVGRARSIAQDETARRRHAASYPLPPTLVVRSLDWSHRRRNVDGSLRGRGSATLASVTVA